MDGVESPEILPPRGVLIEFLMPRMVRRGVRGSGVIWPYCLGVPGSLILLPDHFCEDGLAPLDAFCAWPPSELCSSTITFCSEERGDPVSMTHKPVRGLIDRNRVKEMRPESCESCLRNEELLRLKSVSAPDTSVTFLSRLAPSPVPCHTSGKARTKKQITVTGIESSNFSMLAALMRVKKRVATLISCSTGLAAGSRKDRDPKTCKAFPPPQVCAFQTLRWRTGRQTLNDEPFCRLHDIGPRSLRNEFVRFFVQRL